MSSKIDELKKIINLSNQIINILKDNLDLIKTPADKLGFVKNKSTKRLNQITKSLRIAFTEVNNSQFRQHF